MKAVPFKTKKIIRYRYENVFATLQNIADKFGVTKSYIHQVLKAHNVPTTRVRKKRVRYCPECGEVTTRKACAGMCSVYYHNRRLKCIVCRMEFFRKRWRITGNYEAGYINQYCSRRCYNNRSHAKALAVLQQPQLDAT